MSSKKIDLTAAKKLMNNVEIATEAVNSSTRDSDKYVKNISDLYGALIFLQQEVSALGADAQKIYVSSDLSDKAESVIQTFVSSIKQTKDKN